MISILFCSINDCLFQNTSGSGSSSMQNALSSYNSSQNQNNKQASSSSSVNKSISSSLKNANGEHTKLQFIFFWIILSPILILRFNINCDVVFRTLTKLILPDKAKSAVKTNISDALAKYGAGH